MALGNDILLYESRKRAIERVRESQEKSMRAVRRENFDSSFKNFPESENKNFQSENVNGKRADCNRGQQNINSGDRGGITSLLDNIFKGNKGGLEALKNQAGEISKPLKGLMDYFDLDSEKLIIIMIMWVLFSEKGDKQLLLALGYLLL